MPKIIKHTKSTTNNTIKNIHTTTIYNSDDEYYDDKDNKYNYNDNTNTTMYVIKRDGVKEEMSFDKISKRLRKLSNGLKLNVMELTQLIITQLFNLIPSSKIDELAADTCAARISNHPDYGTLASRIIISNHHKNTSPSFSETIQALWNNTDICNKHCPVINEKLYKMTMEYKEKINSTIDYSKDYNLDYFGFKTLERAYLLKANNQTVERYQHLLMRVALGIHKNDIREALRSYKMMAEGYFTHATPTMFNVGTQHEQAFSCFLMQVQNDSIRGIYKTLTDCALISKWAGGIGLAVHKIRAKGSEIRGTQGISNGIVPMLQNFNATARYVDQGGGKRNGSFAIYIEPWHADIMDFLMLRRNTGSESERARDLFYALWVPDLFMKRVESNGDWTLMCPDECPGLHECYGEEFDTLYEKYECEGRGRRTIKAQDIWKVVLESQIENGMPYIGYKDAVNRKSNQKNLGTIQSSNLCHEICEYTSPDEIAVCCLVSVALPKFLEPSPFTNYVTHNPNTLTIYGKSGCKLCTLAKNMLTNNSIRYKYVNLDSKTDDERETILSRLAELGAKTIPTKPDTSILTDNKMQCDGNTCQLVNTQCSRIMLPVITSDNPIPLTSSTKNNNNTNNTNNITFNDDNYDGDYYYNVSDSIIYNNNNNNNNNNSNYATHGNDDNNTTIPNTIDTNADTNADTNTVNVMTETLVGGIKELEQLLLPIYNYDKLRDVTKMTVRNLNKLIDYNYYPVPETETSNRRHRPIGIGIQGLADVFSMLKLPFDSNEAVDINAKIAEYMYLGACEASMELARKRKAPVQQYRRLLKRHLNTHNKSDPLTEEETTTMNQLQEQYFIYPDEVDKLPMSLAGAYSSFVGSPSYDGKLQFDLWDKNPSSDLAEEWDKLKVNIAKHGLRNSLLMARMPTASTAQILGNNACMEPYLNNVFARKTLAGNFTIINKHLIKDLLELDLWNNNIKNRILLDNGSIQDITEIPLYIRQIYKTVWEIKQKWIVDHSTAAAPFICQTQSMNLFVNDPTFSTLNKMQFYVWRQGLKTGVYYTRTRAKTSGQKFAVDSSNIIKSVPTNSANNSISVTSNSSSFATSPISNTSNVCASANIPTSNASTTKYDFNNKTNQVLEKLILEQSNDDVCESCAG